METLFIDNLQRNAIKDFYRMKKTRNDSKQAEQLIYFMNLANLLRERTEALKDKMITPETIRKVLRFEPKDDYIVPVSRNDYVDLILNGWKQLPREIKMYLAGQDDEIDVHSRQVRFKLDTLLAISEFLVRISSLNDEIRHAASVNPRVEDPPADKDESLSWSNLGYVIDETKSLAELAVFPKRFFIYLSLQRLNREYADYLRRSLEMVEPRLWLENDDTIRFTTSPLVDLFEGIRIKRIRPCKVCRDTFFAKRAEAWACSANCANTLRQRRWMGKKARPNGATWPPIR